MILSRHCLRYSAELCVGTTMLTRLCCPDMTPFSSSLRPPSCIVGKKRTCTPTCVVWNRVFSSVIAQTVSNRTIQRWWATYFYALYCTRERAASLRQGGRSLGARQGETVPLKRQMWSEGNGISITCHVKRSLDSLRSWSGCFVHEAGCRMRLSVRRWPRVRFSVRGRVQNALLREAVGVECGFS